VPLTPQIEDYLKPGDFIQAIPRSQYDKMIRGTLVSVEPGEPGGRELIIVREGETLERDGALGINERAYVMSVQRGDILLQLGSLMTMAEATEKADRSLVTQARKNQKDFPLFADQAQLTSLDPVAMVARFRKSAQKELERELPRIEETNAFRERVRGLISQEDYEYVLSRAQSYPANPSYRTPFWRKQLAHIEQNGACERVTFPSAIASSSPACSWMKLDGPAVWKSAPERPIIVRLLFFGRETVLVKPAGEPIRDYNPKLLEGISLWLKPDELEADPRGWTPEWTASLPDWWRFANGAA